MTSRQVAKTDTFRMLIIITTIPNILGNLISFLDEKIRVVSVGSCKVDVARVMIIKQLYMTQAST